MHYQGGKSRIAKAIAGKSQNASNSPTTKATAKIIEREERLYWHQGSDAVAGSSPPT